MSVLDDLRRVEHDIRTRMEELQPLVAEYVALEQAARRLGIAPPASVDGLPVDRPRAGRSTAARGRRRPQAPPGERRAQVLELVAETPGMTVREMGDALGVDPTSLYRVVRELEADGTVVKDGVHVRLTAPRES